MNEKKHKTETKQQSIKRSIYKVGMTKVKTNSFLINSSKHVGSLNLEKLQPNTKDTDK